MKEIRLPYEEYIKMETAIKLLKTQLSEFTNNDNRVIIVDKRGQRGWFDERYFGLSIPIVTAKNVDNYKEFLGKEFDQLNENFKYYNDKINNLEIRNKELMQKLNKKWSWKFW